jgi:flagellar biosynthesis anti-sigma factor FlgM
MPIDGINGKSQAELIQFRTEKKELPGDNHRLSNAAPAKSDEDDVQVSAKAQEFLRVKRLVDSLPDVRIDRINELAKAIDAGTYHPKAEEVASALIDKNLIDKIG